MTTIDHSNTPTRTPLLARTTVMVLLSLLDQLSISGTRFVTTVLLARVAGKAELGLFSIAFGFLLVATCIQEAFLSGPFSLFIQRRKGHEKSMYQGSVLLMLLCIAAFVSATFAILWALGSIWREEPMQGDVGSIGGLIGLLAISSPFILLREFARRVEIARLSVHYAFAVDALAAVLQLLTVGLLIQFDYLNARTVYVAMALSSAIPALVWLLVRYRDCSFGDSLFRSDAKKHWDLSKWPMVAQIIGLLHLQGTLWVLGAMFGPAAAGKFTACNYVLYIINPLALGACSFVMPLAAKTFSEQGLSATRQLILRFMLGVSIPVAFACAGVAMFSDLVLQTLYNDRDYVGLGLLMAILGLNMTLSVAHMINDQGVWAMDRSRWLFQSNVITAFVSLVLVIPCMWLAGLVGAAFSMLLGRIAGLLYQNLLFFFFDTDSSRNTIPTSPTPRP
ncbi:lipopolysaccharide biosynthesis protein [Pirellulaceae bacterium SH501]